jgi:predicted O-methyltransferase YrrM
MGALESRSSLSDSTNIVRDLLTRAFPGKELREQRAFTRAGMSPEELTRLYELVASTHPADVLEVGMGHGTSTVVILAALTSDSAAPGKLASVDPFQTTRFEGLGQHVIRSMGYMGRHRLIEKPDYVALPELLAAGERFDIVLVDGYHSFDYTLVDVFYADLLLRDGGTLVIHDSSWPAVFKTLRFLEGHKDYHRVSPPPFLRLDNYGAKALRRLRIYASGSARRRAFEERRTKWHTLAAYRKRSDQMAPEFDADF